MGNTREPEAAKSEKKPALTTWLPIVVSTLALFVSLTGQYYQVLLQVDDLRVVIGGRPNLYNLDLDAFGEGIHSLTLINAGTRPAALTEVGVKFVHVKSGDRRDGADCAQSAFFIRKYALLPGIVKPGEIERMVLHSAGTIASHDFRLVKDDEILVCLDIWAITPDNEVERKILPKYVLTAGVVDGGTSYDSGSPVPPDTIVRQSFVRFWKWRWRLWDSA